MTRMLVPSAPSLSNANLFTRIRKILNSPAFLWTSSNRSSSCNSVIVEHLNVLRVIHHVNSDFYIFRYIGSSVILNAFARLYLLRTVVSRIFSISCALSDPPTDLAVARKVLVYLIYLIVPVINS